jgi:hypothetical protein
VSDYEASNTAQFKLKVIIYTDKDGKQAATSQSNMDSKCVCTGCNEKQSAFQKEFYPATQRGDENGTTLVVFNMLGLLIPAYVISKCFKVTRISNALGATGDKYMKMHAIGSVYVAQIGSPEF